MNILKAVAFIVALTTVYTADAGDFHWCKAAIGKVAYEAMRVGKNQEKIDAAKKDLSPQEMELLQLHLSWAQDRLADAQKDAEGLCTRGM